MTKFIVRCLAHGTHLDLALPGRNPDRAIWAAERHPIGRKASAYIVYERKTMNPVKTAVHL